MPPPLPASPPVLDVAAHEALFLNLASVALAEGGLDKREQKFLAEQGRKSDISPDRMKVLFARAQAGEGEVHATTRDDLVIAACLALADGNLSSGEMSHLIAMGEKIGLKAKDVLEVVRKVEGGYPPAATA